VTTTWDPKTFNPHDPQFLANPYPTYQLFREQAPLSVVQPFGSTWVFRWADVQQMLNATDVFVKHSPLPTPPAVSLFDMNDYLPPSLFSSDPPRHTELRAILEPIFTEAITDAPAIATSLAQTLLAPLQSTARMELVTNYALQLPAGVLFSIMGIPQPHWPILLQWIGTIITAHDVTQSLSVRLMGATANMALNTYFEEWVIKSRTEKVGGILGLLCATIGQAGGLTAEDVQVVASNFVVPGYLSTTFLICNGLLHLLENPDQLALLRATPSLMPAAIEEILRMDAPAQVVDRVAAIDTELGGMAIPAGTNVTAVLGSADRDPAAFSDPDEFRIQRDDQVQAAFGAGIHHCIGAPLARLVAPVAMAALIALPEIAIAGTPQWQTDPYLRGMTSLPISVGS
jgi:cytochrome P450